MNVFLSPSIIELVDQHLAPCVDLDLLSQEKKRKEKKRKEKRFEIAK
jgi:hypothetical protein